MSLKTYKYNRVSFFAPERKKLRITIVVIILLVIAFICLVDIIKDNFTIETREITVTHEQIPQEFDGYRILQISDINGQYFGTYQSRLINAIEALDGNYDIVILTGDYISNPDSDDYRPVLDILEVFKDKTPVYYCLGERDYTYQTDDVGTSFISFNPVEKNQLMLEMEKMDAVFIYPIQEILRGESKIYLTGTRYYEAAFSQTNFDMDKDFSICVTHAPIRYNVSNRIAENNSVRLQEVDFDMCISGHTMGGIIRLPVLGAVYSQEDGLFPQEETTYGLHTDDAGRITNITSGLGCTDSLPFRVLNSPEICVYTLKTQK